MLCFPSSFVRHNMEFNRSKKKKTEVRTLTVCFNIKTSTYWMTFLDDIKLNSYYFPKQINKPVFIAKYVMLIKHFITQQMHRYVIRRYN